MGRRAPYCWHDGKKKERFPSLADAQESLLNAQIKRVLHHIARRRECRVWECPDGKGWHLTSREEWKPQETQEKDGE